MSKIDFNDIDSGAEIHGGCNRRLVLAREEFLVAMKTLGIGFLCVGC